MNLKPNIFLEKLVVPLQNNKNKPCLLKEHYSQCKYKKIICGDMNNSAFSFVYRTIKGSMQDTFETNGSGFGKPIILNIIQLELTIFLQIKPFKLKVLKL